MEQRNLIGNPRNSGNGLSLPFALRFGRRPTVTSKTDGEIEYCFKVTQTIPHTTKPRTPGKPSKYDKS